MKQVSIKRKYILEIIIFLLLISGIITACSSTCINDSYQMNKDMQKIDDSGSLTGELPLGDRASEGQLLFNDVMGQTILQEVSQDILQ